MKRYSVAGNLAVSIGVWLGFLYGDLVFDFTPEALPECMAAAAFFLNFGREVAKGIIDIEGDRKNNVTTIATALGPRWTAIIASVIIFLAIPTSIIPVIWAGATWAYLGSIMFIQVSALVVIIWLISDQRVETVRKIKTIILYIMLFALVSFTLEAFLGGFLPSVIS